MRTESQRALVAVLTACFALVAAAIGYTDEDAAKSAPAYTNADLDGTYSIHDVFAQLDGAGAFRVGVRQFDGVDSVAVLETVHAYSDKYLVQPSGTFRFTSDPAKTYGGSIGGFGSLLAHSRRAKVNEDDRIPEGYSGIRLSVLRGSGLNTLKFKGAYSYHALLALNDLSWRNLFGVANTDGTGHFTLAVAGQAADTRNYSVGNDGQTVIDSKPAANATLAEDGDLLFQSLDYGTNDDPQIPLGYTGLAVFVRRATAAAMTDFTGAYRVHEIRVLGNHAQVMGLGAFKAAGNGAYAGSIVRNGVTSDFSGTVKMNPTGTFSLSPNTAVEGTFSRKCRYAVVTKSGGSVVDGGAGEAWLQIWVRTSGGEPSATDPDGDGLSNAEEAALGTNPNLADTDHDGIPDGVDTQPLVANLFAATPSPMTFTKVDGAADPASQTLTIANAADPFFYWSLSPGQSWITATPTSGFGAGTVTVSVKTTGFHTSGSPYGGSIVIASPGMPNSPMSVPVKVNVIQAAPILSVNPTALIFTGFANGPAVPTQSVAITNQGAGTLQWTATSQAPWLSVQPGSGSGNGNVSVGVDLSSLPSSNLPYTGTVRITAIGAVNSPTDIAVSLTVQPARHAGDAFGVARSSQAQSDPSTAYDSASKRYAVAWSENGAIYAKLFDHDGYPIGDAASVTSGLTGVFAHPCVVANPAQGNFWVLWENRATAVATADLLGRAVGVAPSNTLGAVFNVSVATASQIGASGVYNSDRSEIAVAYSSAESGKLDVRLARLSATTTALLGATIVAQATGDLVNPSIAYDPTHGEYLVAWSDTTGGSGSAQLRAQRVNAASGANAGGVLTLSTGTAANQMPHAAYCSLDDTWAVMWQVQTGVNGADVTMARFAAGQDSATVTRKTIAAGSGDQLAGSLSFSPAGSQFLALWTDQNPAPNMLQSRRVTLGGRDLGNPAPVSTSSGDQATPFTVFNGDDNEFFTVWQDAGASNPQIFAERMRGGSADEDGDGLPNDFELQYGLDPFDATGANGAAGDPDGDGWTNLQEYHAHTDPLKADTDGDGLTDPQEDINGNGILDPGESNPNKADTDGDGFDDGVERYLGSNPQDAASKPATAIYRIDHGPLSAGVTTSVSVYVAIADPGTYTLSLNSPGSPGFVAPAGWTATPVGATSSTLPVGVTVFSVQVTPPTPVTPQTAIGSFAFRLSNTSGVDQTLTAQLVCDTRSTLSAGVDVQALALRYAPVFKAHRDEFYAPIPVEVSLAQASLQTGNGHTLSKSPAAQDLAQMAQSESRLDLNGTTTQQLRTAYSAAGGASSPMVYYTAASLGAQSVEPGAASADVVLQYYVHFFADEWGATTTGGNRHEGDWQLVQVLLDSAHNPYRVTATQQWQAARDTAGSGGESCMWSGVEQLGTTHPVLYVGNGGHSMYFRPGATRYVSASEVHDGLGMWYVARSGAALSVTTDYPSTIGYTLTGVLRINETGAAPWLRYAGRWGQDAFPSVAGDVSTPETQSGPLGPVFMGTTSDPSSSAGIRSFWIDPWAWAVRTPLLSEPVQTTVKGTLPLDLFGKTVVLSDARGRVFRTAVSSADGTFSLSVPVGCYVLCVVERDALGHETFLAVGRFGMGPPVNTLFPTQNSGDTDLGVFTLTGHFLDGSTIYAATDADGDGLSNAVDPDMDNDGIPNESDPDALGDGWLDAFQRQDGDGNGIPAYYDSARKVAQAADTDGDGFIDAIDEDIDNDGYTNAEEIAAGSNPYLYRDTPVFKVGDVNQDGAFDAVDIQSIINMALGLQTIDLMNADFDGDGQVTAVDVQSVINRALGVF